MTSMRRSSRANTAAMFSESKVIKDSRGKALPATQGTVQCHRLVAHGHAGANQPKERGGSWPLRARQWLRAGPEPECRQRGCGYPRPSCAKPCRKGASRADRTVNASSTTPQKQLARAGRHYAGQGRHDARQDVQHGRQQVGARNALQQQSTALKVSSTAASCATTISRVSPGASVRNANWARGAAVYNSNSMQQPCDLRLTNARQHVQEFPFVGHSKTGGDWR